MKYLRGLGSWNEEKRVNDPLELPGRSLEELDWRVVCCVVVKVVEC